MGKMQGKKDRTGYDIDLNLIEELSSKTDYWASVYQFVQKMQFKKIVHQTQKEKEWLSDISLKYGIEHDRLL